MEKKQIIRPFTLKAIGEDGTFSGYGSVFGVVDHDDDIIVKGAFAKSLASYRLTFGASLLAALVNLVFGLLIAWVLVRYKFPGKKIVDALVDLPFAQTIVADGTTLWLYDADLNQVTQRAQEQALGATPAALLASAPDLAALRAEFTLENAPERDGLQWVLATPKAEGGTLKSVQVGFAQGQLAALEIADSFGQQSRIRFSGLQLNPSLPASTFRFTPPAGADVLRP